MTTPGSQKPQPTDITPDTRVGVLLEKFPQLEDALLEMSPTFAKLKNPLLRKTVAKVANLRQVAQIGNIPVAELINKLRQEAGIRMDLDADVTEAADEDAAVSSAPGWVQTYKLHKSLDARPIIESGGRPLETVMADLEQLQGGEKYELIAGFVPAPLIDLARQKGFEIWTNQESPEMVRTYFCRG